MEAETHSKGAWLYPSGPLLDVMVVKGHFPKAYAWVNGELKPGRLTVADTFTRVRLGVHPSVDFIFTLNGESPWKEEGVSRVDSPRGEETG